MTETEIEKLNEGRVLRMSLPQLIPLLRKRREGLVRKLVGMFNAGDPAEKLYATVAELSVTEGITRDLENRSKETEHLEERLFNEQKK